MNIFISITFLAVSPSSISDLTFSIPHHFGSELGNMAINVMINIFILANVNSYRDKVIIYKLKKPDG